MIWFFDTTVPIQLTLAASKTYQIMSHIKTVLRSRCYTFTASFYMQTSCLTSIFAWLYSCTWSTKRAWCDSEMILWAFDMTVISRISFQMFFLMWSCTIANDLEVFVDTRWRLGIWEKITASYFKVAVLVQAEMRQTPWSSQYSPSWESLNWAGKHASFRTSTSSATLRT